jgi:hypothetical protein
MRTLIGVTWRARVAKREKELVCTIVRKASTTSEEIMKLAIVREIREKLELVFKLCCFN